MGFLSVLSALVIFSPYTVSGDMYYCRDGACPKINCFRGWSYSGYDASGRKYSTCRYYTKAGRDLKKFNDRIKETVNCII